MSIWLSRWQYRVKQVKLTMPAIGVFELIKPATSARTNLLPSEEELIAERKTFETSTTLGVESRCF